MKQPKKTWLSRGHKHIFGTITRTLRHLGGWEYLDLSHPAMATEGPCGPPLHRPVPLLDFSQNLPAPGWFSRMVVDLQCL